MVSLLSFNEYFQKNVLKHIEYFLCSNNYYFYKHLESYFYCTFYKYNLVTSYFLVKIFSKIKLFPSQVGVLIRQEYVRYTYFPLCWENTVFLKRILTPFKKKRIYELAAGNGWVSYYLNRMGLKIDKVVDDFSWEKLTETEKPIKVYKQDAIKTIKDENPDVALINWPPPEDNFLINCFDVMKKGNYLVIIADKDPNVSGNVIFFKNYEKYLLIKKYLPYSFPDFQDIIYIYQKK
ncbi:hypothetical protein FHQ18_05090 [Deferribacter autotrophicus]|uniref:Class I SAM-dependent methyltransferase n=1 Tax=Deferribacter autotrophicus TaxID=500465 RepID=A0A5A8F577_9BACT|nr:hypothetical protein [Deferribacter autotrophicus]KAA0258534.1 hypothetical protein FHQ18_05090 [Deferribacter autotrophicus]